MAGYRQGLHGPLLDYTIKKYKGHRTIPLLVGKELEDLESSFKAAQQVKLEDKLRTA
jgi:hypothetical protein